jgi:hypothetical protein
MGAKVSIGLNKIDKNEVNKNLAFIPCQKNERNDVGEPDTDGSGSKASAPPKFEGTDIWQRAGITCKRRHLKMFYLTLVSNK